MGKGSDFEKIPVSIFSPFLKVFRGHSRSGTPNLLHFIMFKVCRAGFSPYTSTGYLRPPEDGTPNLFYFHP